MRAVTVRDYGAAPVVMDLPTPAAGPGQVLIKIAAAGMNPMDAELASGEWPADLAGREGAGRDLAAICQALAETIDAELVVFERSCHNPQIEEHQAFNRLLRNLWSARNPHSTVS